MSNLPITHMTLYKHGVGFFERRAQFHDQQVALTFRVEDMNDVLKSLTAIDWGEGQVLGIEYATPQTLEERLAGCSIRLSDYHSFMDLLVSLRGRRIRLTLEGEQTESGLLVGLDQPPERQPLATALVSLLIDEHDQVHTFQLGVIRTVDILDERGAGDLRFFLQTSLSQEMHRTVTVRLSAGDHDLTVSYVAPAPTWRVSYRLVAEEDRALLQGWGIFDNRLEEDLTEISLSLVAGMPISFIYDLYTPFTPERPEIKEGGRVAARPPSFGRAKSLAAADALPATRALSAEAPVAMESLRMSADMMEESVSIATQGEDLGELFQYEIQTPVTVGRGQSAMVPIVSTRLDPRKDLIYNGRKQAEHPVATLRLTNESGLTLEKGPVTVLERGNYVGEAMLPFTPEGAELMVPYAVELGVKVREESGQSKQTHSLQISGAFLRIETWDIRYRQYRLTNEMSDAATVLVEHPRTTRYDLFDTPKPEERTDDEYRFEVEVPARGEYDFRVQERRLTHRREDLHKQSYRSLKRYLDTGLIDRRTHDQVTVLLRLWEQLEESKTLVGQLDEKRQKVYAEQQQIQGNLKALGSSQKETALRDRYVGQLESSETDLKALKQQENDTNLEIERLEQAIQDHLADLA